MEKTENGKIKVVGVRFRTAGKIYYFDPGEFELTRGMHVIVETARGMEYGFVVGTPMEVFEMPTNIFVAEFIGAPKMNILKTRLVKENGRYYVTPFGTRIPVDGERAQALEKKGVGTKDILLGVRPEHIVLSAPGEHAIPCTLEVNEMMGSELHLHVKTADETRLIVRVPTINLEGDDRTNMNFGKPLNLTFESKVMHFFDPDSQKNLLV